MSVKRAGRIEYIEPNNMNYRNVYNDALKYDAFAKGKHFVGNNDGGAVDAKIQGDRFMPYDLEDLCIAMDFYVLTNNRNNCGSPENDGDSVIAQYSGKGAASYLYGTDSDLPEQGAVGENSLTNKHFMTTNFTDISLVNPVGNTSECVGISSINIEYSNIFTPIVRVTFVDVMGASIFLKEEKGMYDTMKNAKDKKALAASKMSGSNLLASLFMYPYPTFVLTLKGFFGDAVSYHLVCSGTDIKFNESVGNFEIRADFAGSLYGALADIPMTFLAIAPYIDKAGRVYWENETKDSTSGRFFFKDYEGNKTQVPMKTFSELLYQNDNLSDNIKKSFETHDEVKEYQKLITARKMIGSIDFPMGRVNPGANMLLDTWYCRKAKSRFYYYWVGVEIESLANSAAVDMSRSIHKDLLTFTNSVNTFNESNLGFSITDPSLLLSESVNPFEKKEGTTVTILNEYYTIGKDSDGFFTSATTKDGKEVKIDQLKEAYPVLNYYLTTDTDDEGKVRYLRLQDTTKRVFIYEIASSSDYRSELVKTKNNINSKIREKKDKIEALKKDALIELYGYTPSLQNINEVALAHLDTFMTVYYETLNNIDSKKVSGERSLQNLGVKLSQTDLPEGYSYTAPLPPFTLFYAPTVNNDKITEDEKWPPVLNNKLSNLDEVKLVESIVEASSLYQQSVGDFIRSDKDVIDGTNRLPGSVYEALENIKSPYSDIISKSNDKHFIDYISAIFALRLYYYLATCKKPDIDTFAFIEAKNFTTIYDKKFSDSVLNYVIAQADTNGVRSYIDKLCGRNVSSKEEERLFSMGLTNKNGGLFTLNGAGELMYTWHKEYTDYKNEGAEYSVDDVPKNEVYVMPIGLFNFETISRDFSSKKSCNNPRYITLNNTAFGGITGSQKDAFNNRNTFRLVDTPNVVIGLFKDKNVIISTKDKNKTKPLEEMLLERITQNKDSNVYLPKSVFFTANDSVAAKKTFSELCEQGSSDSIAGVYDLNKNSIKETYSQVSIGEANKKYNVFLTSVYYNQNKSERGSGRTKVAMSGREINCSMGYLYLYSLVNNRFGMLQSPGSDFNRNGFFAFTELLKEGAFYWRLKFMLSHNGIDPINLDGLGLKNAKANEIYSKDVAFYPEKNEKNVSNCNGLTFIPSTSSSKYTAFLPDVYENGSMLSFSDYINNNISTSIARVENLIQLFVSWATGKNLFKNSKTNFATITYLQELRISGKRLTLDEFKALNNTPLSKLDPQLKAVYKLTTGSNISVKNGAYIDNVSFFSPSDKFDKTEILRYPDYVSMQNSTLALLLDVYFAYDASIFGQNDTKNYKIENFVKSFEKFISILKDFKYDKEDKEAIEHKNKFSSQEIKLSIYLTLKSLYDRWCCSKNANYWKYDLLKENNSAKRHCISQYFVYMDTYYNKVGHNLIANMDNVSNMIKEFTPTYGSREKEVSGLNNGTVLSYMSHIAEKCGCTFYALPQDLTMRRADSLVNMFKPIPYNKIDFLDDTSTFAIVYSPKYSEHLDNGDGYKNDGYDIADSLGNINPILPESFTESYKSGGDTVKIPSFGVTFGKGNQSYFTRIDFQSSKSSVAQSEYAMKALVDVASSANGATKEAKSYGQDIYSQYANYSYQVTVTMLGCCQIMPLMYFQLNNIPLYHGAYIIQSVSHNVNNGMMMTTFTGIRTSRYGLPVQPGNLLILDSMDWGLEEEDFSTEEDNTVWDVSSINTTVVPDTASIMSYDAVRTAKEQFEYLLERAKEMDEAKSPDKNPKPLKKLKGLTVQQKTAVNSYLSAYEYSLSIEKKGPDSGASIIRNSIDFLDENEVFNPNDKSKLFGKSLSDIGYDVVINVGSNISGYTSDGLMSEIEMRLRQLRPAFGDVLVYYASEVIEDRLNDETRKFTIIDKNRIKGSDFKALNAGFASFYYGDETNSDERHVFSDVEKAADKIFYYTEPDFDPKNPNHSTLEITKRKNSGIQIDCYKWDVVLYRRNSSPIGSSVKKKAEENK